jgi:hypothetical protein
VPESQCHNRHMRMPNSTNPLPPSCDKHRMKPDPILQKSNTDGQAQREDKKLTDLYFLCMKLSQLGMWGRHQSEQQCAATKKTTVCNFEHRKGSLLPISVQEIRCSRMSSYHEVAMHCGHLVNRYSDGTVVVNDRVVSFVRHNCSYFDAKIKTGRVGGHITFYVCL